jgi:hypothetical protein
MSVYFKHETMRNVLRHQGIPAMRSATPESLQQLPEAVTNCRNQLSMKPTEKGLAKSLW